LATPADVADNIIVVVNTFIGVLVAIFFIGVMFKILGKLRI